MIVNNIVDSEDYYYNFEKSGNCLSLGEAGYTDAIQAIPIEQAQKKIKAG